MTKDLQQALDPDVFAPDYRSEPYWWTRTPRPEPNTDDLPASTDVAIIGSGYTGLCAALEVARAGRSTLVLDSGLAGWGCSSRNGGQISTSIKPSFDILARKHGAEAASAIIREGQNALAWIGEFVGREAIDCDFMVPGRFHAAHNPTRYEALAREADAQPRGLEVPVRVVPRREQREELGTDAYFGGVVYENHASLDPGRYHRGLLDRVTDAGAIIAACCPVNTIERSGSGFLLGTGRGTVAARHVIVATNGYTGPVSPYMRRRVIPIGSYMIATEPFDPVLMDRLMPRMRVVSDTRRVVYYYRPSPDRRRILFGGRVSVSETDPTRSAPMLRRDLVAIFPELEHVRVSHSWMGFVAYTFDHLAHIGCHDGLHFAMGYCGSGVSMASYFGMRVGQQVLGRAEGRTALDDIRFETRPLYFGSPWFLAASVAWYRRLDQRNI